MLWWRCGRCTRERRGWLPACSLRRRLFATAGLCWMSAEERRPCRKRWNIWLIFWPGCGIISFSFIWRDFPLPIPPSPDCGRRRVPCRRRKSGIWMSFAVNGSSNWCQTRTHLVIWRPGWPGRSTLLWRSARRDFPMGDLRCPPQRWTRRTSGAWRWLCRWPTICSPMSPQSVYIWGWTNPLNLGLARAGGRRWGRYSAAMYPGSTENWQPEEDR